MDHLHIGTYLKDTTNEQEVYIPSADVLRHIYAIGQTGAGKSTMVRHFASQFPAFCLIDKEGDLAREIADAMPCIYLRASDFAHPFGLNILGKVPKDDRSAKAGMALAMFSDLFDLGPHTPLLNDYLYASLRLALDTGDATLLSIPHILTDDAFRARYLKKCTDRETRAFWEDHNKLDAKQKREAVKSTLNKAHAFTRSLPVRLIFGQINSTINIRDIMDTGKTVVLDLSGIERAAQKLIGGVFTFAFYTAAQQRTGAHRPDYALIIDEFRDYASKTIEDIAAESRKRHLALIVAHQYVAQIDEEIQNAIFANFGSFIVFNVGALDTPLLSKVLATPESVLADQPTGSVWARVMIAGRRHRAVPIAIPNVRLPTGFLDANIAQTRARYSRSRSDVEYQLDWYERVKWARSEFEKKRDAEAKSAADEAAQSKKKPSKRMKRVTRTVEEFVDEGEETGW